MYFRSGFVLFIILTFVMTGCTDKTTFVPENNNSNTIPNTEIPGNETGPDFIDYSIIPIIDQQNPHYWNEHNASEVARIALSDGRAKQLLEEGGKIIGVLVVAHPTPKFYDKPAIGPALRILSEEKTVDFLVDEANQSVLSLVIEAHPETWNATRT
jgi:hypothetical protein